MFYRDRIDFFAPLAKNTTDFHYKKTKIHAVYVYNDKMLTTFNYKDGDSCVTFDEIN